VGAGVFLAGLSSPAAIPLVMASGLPTALKMPLAGMLAVGVPELVMLGATGIMGREGLAELKRRFGRFVRLHGPPDSVGATRYRVGLVMFSAPLALAWLGPYLHAHLPGYDREPLWWHVAGDLVFAGSLFVLGGDFWDKLRALFVHGARAVLPGQTSKADGRELSEHGTSGR
jgi:hypothetical protein